MITFKVFPTYGTQNKKIDHLVFADDYVVTQDNPYIGTNHVTLCLALSIIDEPSGVYSFAHVMWGGSSKIPGENSVDILVDEMERLGAKRDNLGAYVAGEINQNYYTLRNGDIIRERLSSLGIPLLGEDIGNVCPRNVYLSIPEKKIEVYQLL